MKESLSYLVIYASLRRWRIMLREFLFVKLENSICMACSLEISDRHVLHFIEEGGGKGFESIGMYIAYGLVI